MPYVPYARQDRVCSPGEALSIKMFANLINSMNFKRVFVNDVHSDVTLALIDRVEHREQIEVLYRAVADAQNTTARCLLISPDAGALKRVLKISQLFDIRMISANKIRDPLTGDITGTEVHGSVLNKHCIICDDICDGGRTFIELTKVLKAKGAYRVTLIVSHGIFSKGIQILINSGIDAVYTTDSFPQKSHPQLTLIKGIQNEPDVL